MTVRIACEDKPCDMIYPQGAVARAGGGFRKGMSDPIISFHTFFPPFRLIRASSKDCDRFFEGALR